MDQETRATLEHWAADTDRLRSPREVRIAAIQALGLDRIATALEASTRRAIVVEPGGALVVHFEDESTLIDEAEGLCADLRDSLPDTKIVLAFGKFNLVAVSQEEAVTK